MIPRGTVERAYELARTGPCMNIVEIKNQLRREHHGSIDEHLSGQSIRKQLLELCRLRRGMEAQVAPGA